MFLDHPLSSAGRKSAQHIASLVRQLPPGTDPVCPVPVPHPGRRDTASVSVQHLEKQLEDGVEGDPGQLISILKVRQRREETRMTSSFKSNTIGHDISDPKVGMLAVPRDNPPPCHYQASRADKVLAKFSRVVNPPVQAHSFGYRPPTISRKVQQAEAEIARLMAEGKPHEHLTKSVNSVDLVEGIPDNTLARPRQAMFVDISKQIPRPDLLKALAVTPVTDPTAISAEGLSKVSRHGKFYRQPCYDFAKLSTAEPKVRESYRQPGEYQPNIDSCKPRLRLAGAFDRRPKPEFDLAIPSQGPAVGTYNPKDECLAKYSRVQKPAVKVHYFGEHERTRSLEVIQTEAEIARLKAAGVLCDHVEKSASSVELGSPDSVLTRRRPIVVANFAKQPSRLDRKLDREAGQPQMPPGGYTVANGFREAAIDKRFQRQPCHRISQPPSQQPAAQPARSRLKLHNEQTS